MYAQPVKVQSSASQGVGSSSSQNAGSSSYERGMQMLSPGVNGQGVQPSPSAYRRQVPQPTELGSSRAVTSDNQMLGRAGRAGAMQGQLAGFDENGLPLVQKGDCGACGQPISGQVVSFSFTNQFVYLCAGTASCLEWTQSILTINIS